jgi:hypothetical protein
MTKRTTTKLFAVVALATATTACTATSRTPRTILHEPVGQVVRPAIMAEKPILQAVKVELQGSAPRVLPTGAPACGNTQSKAKRDGC